MKRYFFLYLIKLVPVDKSFSISSLDCVSNLQPTLINDNWPFHLSDHPKRKIQRDQSYFEKQKLSKNVKYNIR